MDKGPEPANGDSQSWQEYFERTLSLAFEHATVADEFDAIVIDEGQNFQQSWVDLLELALADSEGSMFYMFLDPAQNIFQSGDPPTISDAVLYNLGSNCRAGDALAKSIGKLLGDPEPDCGIEGGFPLEVIESADDPPPLGPNDVRIDTVHSLKGLETPATIIVETEHIHEAHRTNLLRVGLTRATTFAAWITVGEAPLLS